jgi:hypothetical protein
MDRWSPLKCELMVTGLRETEIVPIQNEKDEVSHSTAHLILNLCMIGETARQADGISILKGSIFDTGAKTLLKEIS